MSFLRLDFLSFNSDFHRVNDFKLLKSNFFIIIFLIDHDFGVVSKSLFANLGEPDFLLCFIVEYLFLHFKFMINLEIIL